MASAVLPSTYEQYWGERKAYMGSYPYNPTNNTRIATRYNPKPSSYPIVAQNLTQNPSSNLIWQTHDLKNHLRHKNEPPKRLSAPLPSSPAVVSDSQLSHRKSEGPVMPKNPFHREYLTFNLASYSNIELKELKKRLMSELQSVRVLLTRIEAARPIEPRPGLFRHQFIPPLSVVSHHTSEASAEKRTPKGNQRSGSSRFVTIDDKIKKKISGQKRALPFAAGPGSKRSVLPKSEVKKVENDMTMKCKQILMKLLKLKHAFVFSKPVDIQGLKLHDYYQIIKHPMDLGTVKSKLSKKEYQTPLDFASDVRLTFENALRYNPTGHEVHTIADAMLSKFERLFQPEYQKYLNAKTEKQVSRNSRVAKSMATVEETDMMMPSVPTIMSSHPIQVADMMQLGSGKLQKPKAKDPNKRPRTSEEKLKLVSHLENTPQEKAEQMVQVMRKRNPRLLPAGGEIELDVDVPDIETLWELDRFANNHNSNKGQIRREDVIENASLDEALKSQSYEPSQLPEVSGQKNKKWDAGEEDIDIGEELPADDYPPVEIDKDPAGASSRSSSSGSSSGDDSSSSDSDSGSSSRSDSDEDSVQSPYVEPKGATAS